MSNQFALPVPVPIAEVARLKTLGKALELCANLQGFDLDKQLQQRLDADKGQFSRWMNGTEGVIWPKLAKLMDVCGNEAPIYWMCYQRGFDLQALRKRETEMQRENRLLREEVAALRRVLTAGEQ